MNKITSDITIIGAGASGMMAAHFCAEYGKKVMLLDHNQAVGRKILISGGGKCNFANALGSTPKEYYSENPHFVKSALSRYPSSEFIELVKEHGIPFEERLVGKLYCQRSAKDINTLLLKLINKPNIKLKLNQKNLQIECLKNEFIIKNEQLLIKSQKLVIATGGIVLPQIGASDFGHQLAKRIGHKIIPMSPALVPLKVPGFSTLSGNAFIMGITCNGYYVEENVLITHKGFSGPGILKASLHWNPGDPIEVNWLPSHSFNELIEKSSGKTRLDTLLKKHLPNSFVDHFFERIKIDGALFTSKISKKLKETLEQELHHTQLYPTASEGFRKAEVTRGGICTSKISSKTLESKLQPGLHFIGEVLDVTGQLGGHNFQWCWASAHAVGQALR